MNVRATPLFFWEFSKSIIHENHDGHYTANEAFRKVFENTGYNFVLVDFSPSLEWEGFGKGTDRLDMFKRLLDRYNYEFEIIGKTVYMRHLIGNDTNFEYRYKLNASNISNTTDASGYFTHIKGFGNFEEGEEDYFKNAKLKREFTHPLANVVGKWEGPPIIDGRVKQTSTLDEAMAQAVEDSLSITIEGTLHDVRAMGYDIAVPIKGDRVWLSDERINLDQEIRLHKIVTTYDIKGNIIACDVTFGSQSVRDRHKASINSLSKRFSDLLTGKLKLPIISLEQIGMDMINAIHAASSEIVFGDFGMQAISKTNPNHVFGVNSEGWYISQDGGRTPRTIATAQGIYADALFAGTLWLTNDLNIEGQTGYLNITGERFLMRSKTHPNNAVEITPFGININGFDGREFIVDGVMKGQQVANIQRFNLESMVPYDGRDMRISSEDYHPCYVLWDRYKGRYLDLSGTARLASTGASDWRYVDIEITEVGSHKVVATLRKQAHKTTDPEVYSWDLRIDMQSFFNTIVDYRRIFFYVNFRIVNPYDSNIAFMRLNQGEFYG